MLNKNFDGLMVKLASPERIRELSNGVVESPDTINYRTGKPKNKGLFCESIFGPVRNYECSCGRYKGVRYKGIVCERCGVEVVNSRVRRERMGHIELASPVAHIWYIKATPSRLGLLLDLSVKEIEKIIYFVKYVVVDLDEKKKKNILGNLDKDYENKLKELDKAWEEESKNLEEKKEDMDKQYFKYKKEELEKLYSSNKDSLEKEYSRVKSILANLKVGSTILESDYRNIFFKYQGTFNFQSGANALYKLLERIDVGEEINSLLKTFNGLKTGERDKSFKKLRFLINLYVSGIRPEWMILKYLPVMPPELRPVVQLEGGKFASSDINLFYRRVLMRNLRLKKMIEAGMPEVIKKNEVRLLQEAVNNLIVGEKDNSGSAGAGVKVFKSLTDMLSGKEGIFRKNLLGKRVDYSGRSVITVGPELNLDECGLPLYIAVRMFTPFIIGKLIDRKLVHTPKQAEKLIKDEDPVALKILEEVIKDKYVLLNRAPTLHRLGIQAFKIKLVPGKTIRIHPLVCNAFNADFDGDQMAVHLPLSEKAQEEVKNLIASDKNILKPASGEPIINHSQDMVLGIYYLTSIWDSNLPKVGRFSSLEEVKNYFYAGNLKVGENIEVVFNGENIETTVGRVLFNLILPEPLRFVNEEINKKSLKKILDKVYDVSGREQTVFVADEIKNWGLKYSTLGAVSINAFDFVVPTEKQKLIDDGDEKVVKIHNFWYKGFYSDEEKHRLVVKVWTEVKNEIGKLIKTYYKKGNDVYSMIDSGARGDWSQLTQISGMMGMVASPSGKIIELPVKSSYFDGFSPIEYFIAAHGARKGKADTALKTAESGYLTRRLVDATQEVIIREEDCGSEEGLIISREEAQMRGEDFYELLMGRTVLDDLKDNKGNIILKSGTFLDKEKIKLMEDFDIENIRVRSPLTCNTPGGVCQKCYGMDLSTRDIIKIGTAIGIVSSQSIGEPATQLTMRTFHGGGTASSEGDMTQGIKRIEELFEVRKPAKPAIVSPFDGTAQIKERGNSFDIEIISEPQQKTYLIKDGYKVNVKKGDYLKKGGIYASKGKSKLKIVEEGEVVSIKDDHIIIGELKKIKKPLSAGTRLKIKDGDQVFKGQILSTGALDVREYKDIVGYLETQKYIVREIKKVYTSQGQDVNDKYMELVIKQLFSKIVVEDSGDSSFIPGSVIKYEQFKQINEELEKEGKQKARGERLILGLTQIAKESDSWLSAASFQETMRVMVDSSTKGAIDKLEDLKSNVIIGRLLPVGNLFEKEYYKNKQEE